MNRQERGVEHIANYFNHRPTGGDVYSYTPIPNSEIYLNNRRSLGLPIRLVDERLDSQSVWSRVEKYLVYWESNAGRLSDSLPVADKIQIARLSSSGYSQELLATSVNNIFPKFVELRDRPYGGINIQQFKNRVTQALYAVLTEDEKKKIGLNSKERTPSESRVDQIYEVYPQIHKIISKLLQEKEDFKIAWERNPHFSDVLTRLTNGESWFDIASSVGFETDEIKYIPVLSKAIDGANGAFKQMLLNGKCDDRLYMILRRFVMAKFSNYGIDWNGKQPGKKFYEISCKLLNNSTGGLLERFIKLIPALEALGMSINTPSINWSFVELKRKFPGFDVEDGRINITTASKENVLEYFQRFSQNQVISPGIICLARHMAAGGSAKQVASSLRKVGFRYSQVGMEVIVGKGLLFIERILLSNGKDFKKTDDEIFRSLSELNTKQDIRFLMTTIAQEIAQNKNN